MRMYDLVDELCCPISERELRELSTFELRVIQATIRRILKYRGKDNVND